MKAYPKYKDAGVAWLGHIPEHWEIRRTKFILKETEGRSNDGTELLLSVSQYTGVTPRRKQDNSDVVDSRASSLVGYKVVQNNDLVVNIMLAWNGSLGVSMYTGIVSPAYCIYRFSSAVFPKYYHYLYKTDLYKTTFKAYSTGVVESRLRLYSEKLGCIESFLPPLEEQQKIARYLDWKTSQINRCIKAKKKLIDLFVERRNILINKAISNSSVRYLRIQTIAEQVSRPVNREVSKQYTPVGLFNRERGIFLKSATPGSELGDSTFHWIKEGDLVISGQFAWEGAVAIATQKEDECIASHRYPILHAKTEFILTSFLWAFFQTKLGDLLLNYHSRGAAGRNRPLNIRTLLKEKIPVPALNLQKEIEELIKQELKIKVEVKKEENLLQEYHARLVSDMVTGKIDVRDEVIPDFESIGAELEYTDDEMIEDETIMEELEE